MAISKESPKSDSEKVRILHDLALGKEPVRPQVIRRLALIQWLDFAKTDQDFEQIAKFLKEKKVRDLSWMKVYEKSLQVLIRNKSEKFLRQIVDLPSPEQVRIYNLQAEQIRAHYVAKNFDNAWKGLQELSPGRSPASAGNSELSLEQIREDLKNRRGSKESP
jgi:hypothetical protein